jgi:hypothetical protein
MDYHNNTLAVGLLSAYVVLFLADNWRVLGETLRATQQAPSAISKVRAIVYRADFAVLSASLVSLALAIVVVSQTPKIREVKTLRSQVEQIQKAKWPLLTKAQEKAVLTHIRQAKPQFQAFVTCNDSNCDQFSTQLAGIIKRPGWPMTTPDHGPSLAGTGGYGIHIYASKTDTAANILSDALEETLRLQIHRDNQEIPDPRSYELVVIVGLREP